MYAGGGGGALASWLPRAAQFCWLVCARQSHGSAAGRPASQQRQRRAALSARRSAGPAARKPAAAADLPASLQPRNHKRAECAESKFIRHRASRAPTGEERRGEKSRVEFGRVELS